jgi:very-short-patch-repair endonuclease
VDTLREGDIVTAETLTEQGLSRRQLKNRLTSGELVHIRHGAYANAERLGAADNLAVAGDPAPLHAFHVLAALRTSREAGAASHQSAAILHGFDLKDPVPAERVFLTRPPREQGRTVNNSPFLRVHRAELPRTDLTKRYSLPVTTLDRTVIDLARTLPFMESVVVADSALRGGLVTKDDLESRLAAYARWPGINQAKRVISFADGRAESVLESCARVIFADHGLPSPDLQVELNGGQFRADFLWPEYRTIAEADGLKKYAGRDDAIAQLERDKILRELGYKVVHFTWGQLFNMTPDVIRWIRSALDQPGPY